MRKRVLNTVTVLALAGLSSLAMGQSESGDPPALVGRVAVTQGQVSIGSDVGVEMMAAQVNWPVTSGNTISTAPGARTELRIGSTSIRLDGDASLEVVQLDDDNLRLRLHHGSANIRVRNPELVPGFELTTPEARVRLEQPSSLRIDAGRVRGTSSVDVFDGVALVDGGGSQLTVRAGKGAELTDDDVRTLAATRDAFDDWSASRDRIEDGAASARYVGTEMTGYEDLDRYGSWSTHGEYGPLWIPSVASSWVPYRDGSWTWLDPWGWTWVDNAPWGYAPFHYGRWVQVNSRWAWAPGRRPEHWVWAPALVGWVGGAGWNVTFRDRTRAPGTGWYPLSWHDRYVPGYRVPAHHLRWMNEHVRERKGGRDFRPQGLTVVPQDRFRQPGRVNVPRSPVLTAPPVMAHNVPANLPAAGAPPAPPNRPQRPGRPGGGDRDAWRGDARHDGDRRVDNWRGEGRRGDARPDARPDAGRPAELRPVDAGQDADRADRGGRWGGRANDERRDDDRRGEGRRADGVIDTGRVERDGFANRRPFQATMPAPVIGQATPSAQGLGINSPPPHQSPQAGTIVSPPPQPSPTPGTISSPPPRQPAPQIITTVPPAGVPATGEREREWRSQAWQRSDRREQLEELRRNRQPMPAPAPVLQTPAAAPAAPVALPQPVREARTESRFEQRNDPRPERAHRGDWERPMPQRIAPPPPQAAPSPAPAPAPVIARPAMPAPPPVAAARPAPPPRGDGGGRAARAEGGGGRHQQER